MSKSSAICTHLTLWGGQTVSTDFNGFWTGALRDAVAPIACLSANAAKITSTPDHEHTEVGLPLSTFAKNSAFLSPFTHFTPQISIDRISYHLPPASTSFKMVLVVQPFFMPPLFFSHEFPLRTGNNCNCPVFVRPSNITCFIWALLMKRFKDIALLYKQPQNVFR